MVSPSGMNLKIMMIGFTRVPEKLEFVEMRCTIPSPGGKVLK